MRAVLASALIVALTLTATVNARPQVSPDVWRSVAEKVPIGSVVKVRLVSRERLTGILFLVDDRGLTVKPRTRIPEPARRITYDQIDDLRRDTSQSRFGKAAAIGAGIGAACFGAILLLFSNID